MISDSTQNQPNYVVLIEQDPLTRRRIRHNLSQVGCHVDLAKNWSRADVLLERSIPSLILLDWDLEGSEDYLKQLRGDLRFASTFIACCGNRTQVMDRVAALESGADEFLSKPIVEAELVAKVKAGLRIHHLQRALIQKNHLLKMELEDAVSYMWDKLPGPLAGPIAIDFRFIPSQHLGGDCFDYFWLNDHQLVIYLLDVSGHGLGATIMAINILNKLRQHTTEISLDNPSQVLAYLNSQGQISEQNSKYLTIWYGVYDFYNQTLNYASAGHPPAFLLHHHLENEPQALKTPGLPIGLFEGSQYETQEVVVSEGSTLYVFSDGAYEFPDMSGQIWGLNAFQSLVRQVQHQQRPLDALVKNLKSYCAGPKFMDDLSLLKVSFGQHHRDIGATKIAPAALQRFDSSPSCLEAFQSVH